MKARIVALLLLLGVIVLLLTLAACEGSCCYENPPGFRSHQEMLTAVASCANSQAAVCREEVPQRREVWCSLNQRECCALEPALAAQVFAQYSENPCGPAAAAPAATQTAVPLEAENAPQEAVLPENPVPPVEKPEPPAVVLVLPKIVTVTPSPTPPPKPEVVPVPPPVCLAPPVLFDPPDGKNFAARDTIFRWKPGSELKPDEVYDILVSTDGGKSFKSIGTTRDTILPIDFLKWNFAGIAGNFSWTVRVRDASGRHVSCESSWFSMTLTEIRGGPAGVPVPDCISGPYNKCQ